MARPLRIEYPNAYYHVTNTSAEAGCSLFPGELYYQAFLNGVNEASLRFNVDVLAWCLLKNQYHLVVKTPDGNLSRFMRQVDGLYTQHYQRSKRKHGSVFRTRYKSVLFQPDSYLASLSRYIHGLPRTVRKNPLAWPWSSLSLYLNSPGKESLGKPEELLDQFGKGASARAAYGVYFHAAVDRELSRFYGKKNQLSVLGDENFKDKIKAIAAIAPERGISRVGPVRKRPTATRIVSSVADTFNVSGVSILKAARGPGTKNVPRWVAMYLCQEAGAITLQKIATQFGLQRYGTVSTTIGKLKDEFMENPPLVSRVERIRQQLYP